MKKLINRFAHWLYLRTAPPVVEIKDPLTTDEINDNLKDIEIESLRHRLEAAKSVNIEMVDTLNDARHACSEARGRLERAYNERNALAIAFTRAAVMLGWNAGVGIDETKLEWDDNWRYVLYVDLPNGKQVSWHLNPTAADVLVKDVNDLSLYTGKWSGDFHGRDPKWCAFEAPRMMIVERITLGAHDEFVRERRSEAEVNDWMLGYARPEPKPYVGDTRLRYPTVETMIAKLSLYPRSYRVLFDASEDMWGLHEIGITVCEGTTSDGPGSIMVKDFDDEHEAPPMSTPLPPDVEPADRANTNEV